VSGPEVFLRGLADRRFGAVARYEFKYLVDDRLVPEIRRMVRVFAPHDTYSARAPEQRYEVCSLYLDTDDLRLFRQTLHGEKNRFKLRLRTYSDEPDSPVFLELKRRADRAILKKRVRLDRTQAELLVSLGPNGWSAALAPEVRREFEMLAGHITLAGARPVIRVRYRREAFECPESDRVRLTLDTALEHSLTLDCDVRHQAGEWEATPLRGTIFEVKFSNYFPSWVHDLVRRFELQSRSVPKYVLSIEDMIASDLGSVALSRGGFRAPAAPEDASWTRP